jgi:hypothetical protein
MKLEQKNVSTQKSRSGKGRKNVPTGKSILKREEKIIPIQNLMLGERGKYFRK